MNTYPTIVIQAKRLYSSIKLLICIKHEKSIKLNCVHSQKVF